jgi:hypothetical protein
MKPYSKREARCARLLATPEGRTKLAKELAKSIKYVILWYWLEDLERQRKAPREYAYT